jgi:hypothetical protein
VVGVLGVLGVLEVSVCLLLCLHDAQCFGGTQAESGEKKRFNEPAAGPARIVIAFCNFAILSVDL